MSECVDSAIQKTVVLFQARPVSEEQARSWVLQRGNECDDAVSTVAKSRETVLDGENLDRRACTENV